ncbi:MAG: hypothetical protein SPL80_07150 [Bacilli bacterium]|nr:hypothetical protein [Bacilli bacterium]
MGTPPDRHRQTPFFGRIYLDSFPDSEKKTVFFDEFPWLDNGSGSFLKAFDYF